MVLYKSIINNKNHLIMNNTDITEKLFSFKTFRSPDRIGEADKLLLFIRHPNFSGSPFYNCPQSNGSSSDYRSFMNGLAPVSSYRSLQNSYPDFYDFSCRLMLQCRNDSTKPDSIEENIQALSGTDYANVWNELLTQIVTKRSKSALQACLKMIVAQHYLSNSRSLSLDDIAKLAVVIPERVTEFVTFWQHGGNKDDLYGVYNLGIQDFRRVEQTLCCYVPGEVSHIENVMAREYKEKSTRNTLRTEETTELSSESTIENTNDTTSAERNEVSSEIAKILQKDKSFDVSGSVTVSKDSKIFGSISSNVSTGYNSSNSSSLSNTEAKNYAKEVTERAVERIEQKTAEKRTYKIIKEYEETYKHGYDNRLGDDHVTGVYRWVDKIYKNELVNYGKRMVLEIEVPHPAKLYKKALKWKKKSQAEQLSLLTPPQTLADFGIRSAKDITPQNASNAATAYGTDIQIYESENTVVTMDIPTTTVENKSSSLSQTLNSINIPDGYVADSVTCDGSFNYHTPTGTAYLEFIFSGQKIHVGDFKNRGTRSFNRNVDLTPNLPGSVSIIVKYRRVDDYSATIRVNCISDPDLLTEWQEETFINLESAYQRKYDEYSEALRLQQVEEQSIQNQTENENFSNEAANRLIEERELKRSCIEMLSRPFGYEMGQCFHTCQEYTCDTCVEEDEPEIIHIPEIEQTSALGTYAEFVKFFETAFQWEILSYTFYPYYYNPKCSWFELLQTTSDDPIFEAFLQSGMAKVLVPVRPQFEKAVLWYLETGDICTEGSLVPETEDDQCLSIVRELQCQDETTVEDSWMTRVPSTLTIIQANSAYLANEQGLPRNHLCNWECAQCNPPFETANYKLTGLHSTEPQS